MSFVATVPEDQASPALKRNYELLRQKFGFLPNYFQALGRRPSLVEGHLALTAAIEQSPALPVALKEKMGLVVSGLNSASYCIAVHMELLRRLGVEKPLGRKLVTNYSSASVEAAEMALFRFADKLSLHPADVKREDVDALRAAGWDDDAIVEAIVAVSYYNFINRVSMGLGVVAEL
jgi:uncharacterized peroxidase-related enzyme